MPTVNGPSGTQQGPDTPVCDLTRALARMDGSVELLCDVIDVFLEDYAASLQELVRKADQGGPAEFQRAAHTIKGAVANFVAQPATDLAHEIEQLAREGKLPEARSLVPALVTGVESLAAALHRYRLQQEAA